FSREGWTDGVISERAKLICPTTGKSVCQRQRLSFVVKIFQSDTTPGAQAVPRLLDSMEKAGVMLQAVVEPVLFRFEADQNTRTLSMRRDDDLVGLCLTKIAGQIIFDFGERNFLPSGFPNCASHDSASDLRTIANTSTLVPEIS